jgi:alpha-glucosidase (family GH31 glycosyl hydrolase)
VAAISRKVLAAKYSLLPYYNTRFFNVWSQGGTVLRPLFFEFPNDTETLDVDVQFMVGPALLVTPVVVENATSVHGYLPPSAAWYDFWTGAPVLKLGWQTLDAPFDHINVHVRGGQVIPMQEPAMTTSESRQNPHSLLVALDARGEAHGELFLDDGETLHVGEDCSNVEYSVSSNILTSFVHKSDWPVEPPLNNITVLGM